MLRRKVNLDILYFAEERKISTSLIIRLLIGFIKVKKGAILTTLGE